MPDLRSWISMINDCCVLLLILSAVCCVFLEVSCFNANTQARLDLQIYTFVSLTLLHLSRYVSLCMCSLFDAIGGCRHGRCRFFVVAFAWWPGPGGMAVEQLKMVWPCPPLLVGCARPPYLRCQIYLDRGGDRASILTPLS